MISTTVLHCTGGGGGGGGGGDPSSHTCIHRCAIDPMLQTANCSAENLPQPGIDFEFLLANTSSAQAHRLFGRWKTIRVELTSNMEE